MPHLHDYSLIALSGRASGFAGLAISQALVRAGHVVYGVTRSEKNAKKLAEDES
jgi:nucleoside-diphosphate-sugar epimerase